MTSPRKHQARLLTINTGSSSLKAAVYEWAEPLQALVTMTSERIGATDSELRIEDREGRERVAERRPLPRHRDALLFLFDWIDKSEPARPLQAIGHRVVQGGSRYRDPCLVTPKVARDLRALVPIDPNHLPQALGVIEAVESRFPGVPQVACFDTAFHQHIPRVAATYPLPADELGAEVIRYGFHGLSYEYILDRLGILEPAAVAGRVIIAHLGNGASMVAVREGRALDTTMGFTPIGGLMMGTRSGDLDPGVLLYLLQEKDMSAERLSELVSRRAGLLGVSGTTPDMQELLEREGTDSRARDAIDLFCYQAKKHLGALASVLGGIDTLVFTGGIGEHAVEVRERICEGLDFLGITIDKARNAGNEAVVSVGGSPVTVRVIPTNEDLMIARHTYRLIRGQEEPHV